MTAMRLILARSSGSRPSFFNSTMDSSRDFQRQRLVFGRVVLVNADFRIRHHCRRIEQAEPEPRVSTRRDGGVNFLFRDQPFLRPPRSQAAL